MSKPILCLDFDGVVHSYTSGWKGPRNIPDPPVPGAFAFMLKSLEDYDVVIHSSRARYFGGIRAMRRWLQQHSGSEWDNDNLSHELPSLRDVRFARMKPPAIVTIDDRAVRFNGTWPEPKAVMALKPWNKP